MDKTICERQRHITELFSNKIIRGYPNDGFSKQYSTQDFKET